MAEEKSHELASRNQEKMMNESVTQQLETESPALEVEAGMTVDEVIEKHVGSLGWSQLIQVVLVSFAWIFDAQGTLITIFSDAEPEWRCKAGNFGSSLYDQVCGQGNYHRSHKGSAVCGLPPGSWEWVDGHKSSTIAEWGLVCNHKFLAAVPASCFFIGSLIGSVVYGRLADAYLGRKKTMMLSCVLTSITALLTSFSPNIWIYAMLRFSNGFARSGIGICCLVLSTEVVGRKWRGQVGQYGFFFFTVGFISLPLVAYPTRKSWRTLHQIISGIPFVYSIFVHFLVAESPRWLLIKGRKTEALAILANFAKRNHGKELPVSLQLSDPTISDNPGSGNMINGSNMRLWECKWAVCRMCKAMVAGFGVGFVYYGIQLNVENLNFSKYMTVGINGLMEIPAVLIGGLLMSNTNRRVLFSLSSYTAGASCLLCIFFAKSVSSKVHTANTKWGTWIQVGIEGIGFMAASTAFDVLYIYCVELFPTNVRNFAVSLLRQALMLGASVAPLLVVVGRLIPALSFLVFGVLGIVSGLISLWLPETRNAPLYETLEQQQKEERLGHASSCGA